MSKRRKLTSKIAQCAYCGKITVVTRDHVIPKCIFAEPYPKNLVTVPACDPCNKEKSKDDDYLRDVLVLDNFSTHHPIAQTLFQKKTLRSQRRNSSQAVKEMLAGASLSPLYTRGGIFVSDYYMAKIDEDRFKGIIERLVRGLYFHSQKRFFPTGYEMNYNRHFPWEFKKVQESLAPLKLRQKTLGTVFTCLFANSVEDPFSSSWILCFYGGIVYTIFMANPEFSR